MASKTEQILLPGIDLPKLTLTRVEKRNGRIVPFKPIKILNSIFASAKAVGGRDKKLAQKLAGEVITVLEQKFDGHTIPTTQEIQEVVEKTLIENGHAKTAKSYILHSEVKRKLRSHRSVFMEISKLIDDYVDKEDWRIKENSNVDYSFGGLMLHINGSLIANYVLENVYPPDVSKAHKEGDFHLHDLSLGINGYCAGWSLRQLLLEGLGGVPGKTASSPAKHLSSALIQMVNFLGTLQNEWAGAQAFSSFDTYLAPFVREDELSYKEVKQLIQQFVYGLNVSSRWGMQTPFTNITLDWTVPEDLKNQPVIVGGKLLDTTYADYQQEMDVINKAFIEVMSTGDAGGQIFTFPIPTYNITRDFNWDTPNADLLFEMTAKYGIPYFQNFVNSELKPQDVRSMCCRLQMDLRQLSQKTGGLFGSGESTGSIGVVTLNLPRIAHLYKNKKDFFDRLAYLMDLAHQSLEIKRTLVQKNMDSKLLPYTKRYLDNLDHHFATIGLLGTNEACLNFLGKDITTPEGREFAIEILKFMRDRLKQYQEETGNIYNLEATPAEGTSYRLAKIDKKNYPEIITAGTQEVPFYTNSTHLPVGFTDDVFEALEHQDELQCLYSGGTVLHGFLGERVTDAQTCKKLVKLIAHNFKLPYFTITPTFSICPEHGYIVGEHFVCPHHKEIKKEKGGETWTTQEAVPAASPA